MSCFESYELFLKDMYVQLGVSDPACWQANDVQKLLCGNSAAAFDDRRQALRDDRTHDALSLFKRFRRILPDLEAVDATHEIRLRIQLLAKLRHAVVHQEACVHLKELEDSLAEKLGRGLTPTEEARTRAFFTAPDGRGFATIQLAKRGREFGQWDRYLLDTAYQGALVYWASSKKFGYPIS